MHVQLLFFFLSANTYVCIHMYIHMYNSFVTEMQEQSLNEERMPRPSEIVNDPECRTMVMII